MAAVADILESVDRLPALPSTVIRLTAMLTDDQADLGEIEEVARHDEALSMAILRFANSALYGRAGREFNLRQSIVRLGGKMLLRIALEQQASKLFESAGEAYGLRRGALWRGSVGGAFAAEEMAKKHAFPDVDLCFLCGLLRDVGKLVMDAHYGADYLPMVSPHIAPGRTAVEGERAAFGADHAQIGAELALRWRLPQRIADAIRYHHEPPAEEPDHDLLFDIVHAGDIICLWAGLAIGHDGLQYKLAPHVRKGLGLGRREAELDITITWGRLRELEEMMDDSPTQGKST
ncbi:MAG: HDOD domain-containing protein [Planctomycetes bacterium]|nr:HDOD domain-containing protein [Planctomycetota bacterium]